MEPEEAKEFARDHKIDPESLDVECASTPHQHQIDRALRAVIHALRAIRAVRIEIIALRRGNPAYIEDHCVRAELELRRALRYIAL